MISPRLILAAASSTCVLLSACSDSLLDSAGLSLPPTSPAYAVLQVDQVGDDTQDIQNAVNQASANDENLYIPPGTYQISASIRVPSNIRIYGAGVTSLIEVTKTNTDAFLIQGQRYSPAQNVEIDHIQIKGLGGKHFAVMAIQAKDLNIHHNTARNIGVFGTSYTQIPQEHYSDVTSADISSNIIVADNNGNGLPSGSDSTAIAQRTSWGIAIRYARDVTVARNVIKHYTQGIAAWGGDANPNNPDPARSNRTSGKPSDKRWVERISIRDNQVAHIGNPANDYGGAVLSGLASSTKL